MTIYILSLVSILLFVLFIKSIPISLNKQEKVLSIIIGIQLFFIAAFRNDSVGGDLVGYFSAYNVINATPWSGIFSSIRFEYGYVLLNKLCSLISDDTRVLLIVTSFIIVLGYVYYIYKNSRIVWLSFFLLICLGYYVSSLSMLRQSLAIVVLLNGIQFVEKKSFFKFLWCVVLASFFHLTAAIFIILYPISKLKISWGYFIVVFIITILLSQILGRFLIMYLIDRYFVGYEGKIISGEGYSMLLLLLTVTCLGMSVRRKYIGVDNRKMNVYFHIMILACCMQLLSLQFSLFARIVLYFSTTMIVFIPNVIRSVPIRELRLIGLTLICALTTYYFIFIILGRNTSGILPYSFMWN